MSLQFGVVGRERRKYGKVENTEPDVGIRQLKVYITDHDGFNFLTLARSAITDCSQEKNLQNFFVRFRLVRKLNGLQSGCLKAVVRTTFRRQLSALANSNG